MPLLRTGWECFYQLHDVMTLTDVEGPVFQHQGSFGPMCQTGGQGLCRADLWARTDSPHLVPCILSD